jgi:CDGSH-type Zn-finger protein
MQASTDRAMEVQDYFINLEVRVRQMVKELAVNGETAFIPGKKLRVVDEQQSASELPSTEWTDRRLKAVDKHKDLMDTCSDGIDTESNHPGFYACINQLINKTVCGMTKTNFGAAVNENRPKSRWIQRDYFSEEQLELVNILLKTIDREIQNKNAQSGEEKFALATEICDRFLSPAKEYLHGTHNKVAQKPEKTPALPPAPQVQKVIQNNSTITNYFSVVNKE